MELSIREFLKQAAQVKPTRRQLEWYDTEFYAFVHFSPNTFTGLEWGTGKESPAIFNPTNFDPDQWVEAVKSAGMKGLVLTAKHHDGFCLWPSKYTEHCIKNSPFQNGGGDIVRDVAEACRRGGLKFGFYLSPWDRNSKYYGTAEYNDYYKAQLTELLTGYGEIFHVWFDGACGEGPNGKRQEYDFKGYIELIRKYQPGATIFNDHGPDVRWIGNETGTTRYAEWAVVPSELVYFGEKQTEGQAMEGDLSHIYNPDKDIGAISNIIYSNGLVFAGAEVDMSIRPGWFYHEEEEPHTVEKLFDTYIRTVGGNACFHLNIPPNQQGRFDERDVAVLKELGSKIRSSFSHNIFENAEISYLPAPYGDTQAQVLVRLPEKERIHYLVLQEDISQGQRVETFLIQKPNDFGNWTTVYSGTCIGHKKICEFSKLETDCLRILVTSARDKVNWRNVSAY